MKQAKMVNYTLIHFNGDKHVVTIPDTWEVTYGPLCRQKRNETPTGTLCFRVYEGKKQRACFAEVAGFVSDKVEMRYEINPDRVAAALANDGSRRFTGERVWPQINVIADPLRQRPATIEVLNAQIDTDEDVAF